MEIGGYRIVGELGRGGMGVVYAAVDPRSQRRVALKTVRFGGQGIDARGLERLRREADALTRLDHPGLVPCLGTGVGPQGFFVAMALVEGLSLEELLQREGRLPLGRTLRILEDLGAALEHVHQQGLLHRDVKPANVLLSSSGRVVLTDFGLVKLSPELQQASQASLTRSGAMLGTPGYWPPEQALGRLERVGPASDVYGWAATGYALLAGRPPREAPSLLELLGALEQPVASLRDARPEVPGWLDGLLQRCMAYEPSERPSLEEALDLLRGFGRGGGAPRSRAAWVAGLGALALLGLGGVVWVSRSEPEAPAVEVAPPPVVAMLPEEPAPDEDPVDRERWARYRELCADDPQEAHALARDWALERPNSRRAAFAAAEACWWAEEAEEGLQRTRVELELYPEDATLWGMQAGFLMLLRRYDEGLVAAERSLALDPQNGAGLPAMASIARELQDHERALGIYDRLIALEPQLSYLVQRGWLRDKLEDFDGALADAEAALAQAPDHAEALALRGHVRALHRDDRDGAEDLRKALESRALDDPPRAFADLAQAFCGWGQPGGVPVLAQAWFPSSREPAVEVWVATALLDLGRVREALPILERLLQAPDPLVQASCEYARVQSMRGQIPAALDALEAIYRSPDVDTPVQVRAARYAAEIAASVGGELSGRGIEATERWLAREPGQLEARVLRLSLWYEVGDLRAWAEAEALRPEVEALQDAKLQGRLIALYVAMLKGAGRWEEALRELADLIETTPGARALVSRSFALQDLGEFELAERDLLAALQREPDVGGVWFELMQLWERVGRTADAAFAARQVLALPARATRKRAARALLDASEQDR